MSVSNILATLGLQWSPNPFLYEDGDLENRELAAQLCLNINKFIVLTWGHLGEADITFDSGVPVGQPVTEAALRDTLDRALPSLTVPRARFSELQDELAARELEGLVFPPSGDLELGWSEIPYADGAGRYIKNLLTCETDCIHAYALTTPAGVVVLRNAASSVVYAEIQAHLAFDLRKQDPDPAQQTNPKAAQ
ncbi:MAG: hypothetical protein RL885_26180 [Planctomycetota bacterium]